MRKTRAHVGSTAHTGKIGAVTDTAAVIPIPGDRHRPEPAGQLSFATRQAAQGYLYRRERDEPVAAPQAPPTNELRHIKKLRRAMADVTPTWRHG